MNLKSLFHESDDCSRRDFLSGSARALLGLGSIPLFARLAAAQSLGPASLTPATAKSVIYLFMSGGMSHLDTFDPKPGSPTQGPTEVIGTAVDGIQVSSYFRHLARHMDKVAVVNSMSSTQGAHAQGRYYMHTSYELRGTIKHPSLGAWANRLGGKLNPSLPGHVSIGDASYASAGFFESKYTPLPIGDPEAGLQDCTRAADVSAARFDRRRERLARMNATFSDKYDHKSVRAYADLYDEAVRLMDSKDLAAFDLSQEPADVRASYGDNPFGQGCLLARRLVENGVRFVEVVDDGWDTHNDNFEAMEDKCPPLDRALASLLADLEARGLLEETLVVLATEFGRTPVITDDRNGRNHYPKAFTCLLAGGGVRGGQRWGRTDGRGEEILEGRVTVPDFNATIAAALGLPLELEVISPSGRPFTVAHKGRPVAGLLA